MVAASGAHARGDGVADRGDLDAVLGRVALPADEVVHSLLDSELRLGMLAEAVGKAGHAQLWVEREAGVVRRSAFSQYEQEL